MSDPNTMGRTAPPAMAMMSRAEPVFVWCPSPKMASGKMAGHISELARLSNARVYIAAQNLWTWTSYSGYDPEVSVRNSALTPGLDFSSYPRAYSLSFGVNLGF